MDIDKEKYDQVKIGELFIRYDKENLGTLALDLSIDIDLTDDDLESLKTYLTNMNEIIIKRINKSLEENEEENYE